MAVKIESRLHYGLKKSSLRHDSLESVQICRAHSRSLATLRFTRSTAMPSRMCWCFVMIHLDFINCGQSGQESWQC